MSDELQRSEVYLSWIAREMKTICELVSKMTRSLIILLCLGGAALADGVQYQTSTSSNAIVVSTPPKEYEMVANQDIFRLGKGGCLIGPLEIGTGVFKLEAGVDFPAGCSKK